MARGAPRGNLFAAKHRIDWELVEPIVDELAGWRPYTNHFVALAMGVSDRAVLRYKIAGVPDAQVERLLYLANRGLVLEERDGLLVEGGVEIEYALPALQTFFHQQGADRRAGFYVG